jgi:cullin 3
VQALVTNSEVRREPVTFTQTILDLRSKYMRIINEAFVADRQFLQALHQAFEVRG